MVLGLGGPGRGICCWRNRVRVRAVCRRCGCFVLALLLGWVWTVYNSLIGLHHRVEQGWSQVDVQFNRRHDLIPNLATAVAEYRTYESETQQVLGKSGHRF